MSKSLIFVLDNTENDLLFVDLTGERTRKFLRFAGLFRSRVKFEDFLFPLALLDSDSSQSGLEFSVSTDANPLQTKSNNVQRLLIFRLHTLHANCERFLEVEREIPDIPIFRSSSAQIWRADSLNIFTHDIDL